MTRQSKVETSNAMLRWSVIAGVAMIALLGSYAFASSRGGAARASTPGTPSTAEGIARAATPGTPSASGGADPSTSGGCCGTARPAGPATTGKATVAGSVQRIDVDVSKGYYDPNTIELKAGVPAEITFSQSGGCTGQVQSKDLGFFADLTQGPATVKLPALSAGTYGFACGMNMVHGTIIVK